MRYLKVKLKALNNRHSESQVIKDSCVNVLNWKLIHFCFHYLLTPVTMQIGLLVAMDEGEQRGE